MIKKSQTNSLKKCKKLLLIVFCLLLNSWAWGQERTITGIVYDSQSNQPLLGASVLVKNTNNGQVTDFDGIFRNKIPTNKVTLVVSYLGYITKELIVTDQTKLTIQLKPSAESLDEVVVVGYGTKKKINLTGAVQSISAADLEDRVVVDPVKALQGAVPGLNISYGSGQVNSAPTINIRGFESLSGGSPLIVIDGVPSSVSQFTELNPSDVASVSTLMDASFIFTLLD
jgi:hypothetical protein